MASTLFRRILVPHDFSDAADRALREAAALARAAGGRLHVLHVQEPFYVPINVPSESIPNALDFVPAQRAALERRVEKVLGAAAPPVSVAAEVGQPADVILAAARRADSIVMATRGRTGLPHLLLGSVAERVVRHAPIPVLTVRVPAKARSRSRRGAARARKVA
jgi:nucleotide-binding universal stress UspA family protein